MAAQEPGVGQEQLEARNRELEAEVRRLRGQVDALERTVEELRATAGGYRTAAAAAAANPKANAGGEAQPKRAVSDTISKGVLMFEQLIHQAGAAGVSVPLPTQTPPALRKQAQPRAAHPVINTASAKQTGQTAAARSPPHSPRSPTVSQLLEQPGAELKRRVSQKAFKEDMDRILEQVDLGEEDSDEEDEDGGEAVAEHEQDAAESAQPDEAAAESLGEPPAPAQEKEEEEEEEEEEEREPVAPTEEKAEAKSEPAAALPEKDAEEAAPAPAEHEAQDGATAAAAADEAKKRQQDAAAAAERAAMVEIARNLREAQMRLPVMVGYVDKQSPRGLRPWQKRYVAVYDYNIYYSKESIRKEDIEQPPAGRSPIHCLPLVVVNAVVSRADSRVFTVQARDPKKGQLRDFRFRGVTENDTQAWVDGLNDHRNHLLSMLRWVSLNKSSAVKVSWS